MEEQKYPEPTAGAPMITTEELKKLEIKIGKIISAERIENTDKLIKLEVDLGDEKRQIVTGIAEYYKPEDLEGKQIPGRRCSQWKFGDIIKEDIFYGF